jgi:Cys-tRNA(Pro)/Cys-tRNA(Cys) deacylase
VKETKTLAMRLLEGKGIAYQVIAFPDTIHDALGVAEHAGLPAQSVYKTLVVQVVDPASGLPSRSAKACLILVAADSTLDLKRVARALGVKKVQMARQTDAERLTGLKVGGISALALLQRGFDVYLDGRARQLEEIVVSAGQRGLNLRLRVADFVAVAGARWMDAAQHNSHAEDAG